MPNDPTVLAFSTVLITAVCWVTNRVFAMLFRLPVNVESVYITALILALKHKWLVIAASVAYSLATDVSVVFG